MAAVTNNTIGVAGVAFKAQVQHVRVLGRCGGYLSDIADAIIWAAGGNVTGVPPNPTTAQVINMSLGGSGSCGSTYQNAIDYAVNNGTTVVVSAGNSNTNASNSRPANCNNVITVAASDRTGSRASYSNYGSVVEITAPGGGSGNGVASTINTGSTVQAGDGYAYYQGTSMAAPHISGLAAILYGLDPEITPAELLQLIQDNARPMPGSCSGGCGAGLADAAATVLAMDPGEPPPNQPPTANFNFSCTDLSCSFTNTSVDSDGTIASSSWTFGDGGTSTATNPSHTYAVANTYTVTLTVTDDDGAQGSTSQSVTVTAQPSGGVNLVGSSVSTGSTWTAIATDANNGDLQGSWSQGTGTCSANQCSLTGIRKRTGSVTFTASTGESITISKP